LFNNVFTAKGNSYCSNAGQDANLLIENTVYDGVAAPFALSQNGTIVSKGNVFTNTTGLKTGSGNGFPMAPYTYTLDATGGLEATVEANAGPQ
jgi:pectinesterase